MALRGKVLNKKAERFELKKLEHVNLCGERLLALEPLLQDVYASMRPKSADYEVRRHLVHAFNMIAKEIYGKSKNSPVVVEFGSFVMDLFSTTSDLDLSVNFSEAAADFPREKKIQTLRKFASKLYAMQSKGHVYGVNPITTAKVPILKCVDRGTGIECDISVENRDGILKSQIIHSIASMDERFQKLSFLMKIWAKAHNINSSKHKTLNSLSIILLVAFHLQTRQPPVLPPFSVIFKDGTNSAAAAKAASKFFKYGERNQESLAKLFITLLIKLSSVEKLWLKGLCVSNYTASWISKSWGSKVACFSVEDFTDHSQNVSRAVGQPQVEKIYECINISIQHISSFMAGQLGFEIKELLFGGLSSAVPGRIPDSRSKLTAASPSLPPSGQRLATKKRKIPKETGRQKPLESIRGKSMRAADGRRWMLDGRCEVAQRQHARSVGWAQAERLSWENIGTGGWEQHVTRGWGGTQQGWDANPGGWGGIHPQFSVGWGQPYQPSSWAWGGGWKRQPAATSRGWGGRHDTTQS